VDWSSETFDAILVLFLSVKITSRPHVIFSFVFWSRPTTFQKPFTKPFRSECATGMRKNVVGLQRQQWWYLSLRMLQLHVLRIGVPCKRHELSTCSHPGVHCFLSAILLCRNAHNKGRLQSRSYRFSATLYSLQASAAIGCLGTCVCRGICFAPVVGKRAEHAVACNAKDKVPLVGCIVHLLILLAVHCKEGKL
jgi:hypothetical protein